MYFAGVDTKWRSQFFFILAPQFALIVYELQNYLYRCENQHSVLRRQLNESRNQYITT